MTTDITPYESQLLALRGYELIGLQQRDGRGWVAVAYAQRPCSVEDCRHEGPCQASAYGRTARSAIRNLIQTVLRP